MRPALWLALATFALGVLLEREIRLGTFSTAESAFLDWLVANAGAGELDSPEVVVFELRDDTGSESKSRPLTPLECALFFEAISRFDPPVVLAEPLLRWEPSQPEGEQMVLQRALKLPRLIASSQFGNELSEDDEAEMPDNVSVLRNVSGETSHVPEFRAIAAEPFDELTLAASRGFLNLAPGTGLDANLMPMVFRFRGELVPSAALQALILWKRLTPGEVKVELGRSIEVGGLRIPIDASGAMLVNRSLSGELPRFSVDDLLFTVEQLDAGGKSTVPEEMIRKGISIFGYDRNIPRQEARQGVAGALTLATAIATAQSGKFIARVEGWISYVIALAIAFVAIVIRKASGFIGLLICLALLGMYGLISLWVFEAFRLWMPFVLPSLLFLFVAVVRLFLRHPQPV